MFFIVRDWNTYPENAANCLHCSPENIIDYCKTDFPLIFPNQEKALRASILDKEIGFSCRRRMFTACELFIEFDKDFSEYEVEIYSETDNKPLFKSKTDRQSPISKRTNAMWQEFEA